jgi:Ca-activated chloride channel homolog
MKSVTLAIVCLGLLGLSTLGQTNKSTRPRVAPTPVQDAPTLKNEIPEPSTGRRAPVLSGSSSPNRSIPSNTPTSQGSEEDEVVRVETNLVTMPVSVLDREGRFIAGLQQRDFKIFENGIEQKVEHFQSVEQPFTVVLMIDVSPSTAFAIDEIHDGAIAFVNQLRPADRVMVIAFDDRVRVLSRPTNDRRVLRDAINRAQFGDGTSLYEAVDHVINRELANIPGRKAVVLFTDGVDTTSRRANYQSTLADVEEVDALFYPIRYNTQRQYGGMGGGRQRSRTDDWIGIILGGGIQIGGPAGSSSREYATGLRYLEALAQNSGGRKFEADSLYNLEASFAGIAEELRRQYSLGYYPDKVGQAGERRRISVRVTRPNVMVKAKSTYVFGQSNRPVAGT